MLLSARMQSRRCSSVLGGSVGGATWWSSVLGGSMHGAPQCSAAVWTVVLDGRIQCRRLSSVLGIYAVILFLSCICLLEQWPSCMSCCYVGPVLCMVNSVMSCIFYVAGVSAICGNMLLSLLWRWRLPLRGPENADSG